MRNDTQALDFALGNLAAALAAWQRASCLESRVQRENYLISP
jgi:hypothetical protein